MGFKFRIRSNRKQAGQSMVEITMMLPLMIMLVFALIETGILFASYISLVNAAREGAIFASMYPQLADPSTTSTHCISTPNPTCVAAHDADPVSGGSVVTATTSIWDEYFKRVNNEVVVVLGDQLKTGEILDQDTLILQRPVVGPTGVTLCPGSDSKAIGCPITVTVLYGVHTLTSDMSLPGIGRFGLPNYITLQYSIGMPIR